jgi:hypothetical protein
VAVRALHAGPDPSERQRSMYDGLMLLLGVGSFALFIGYAALCVNL